MFVFRIARLKWIDVLSGSGVPGRWNDAGAQVLYTSSSLALAVLEMLVHLERDQVPEYFWKSAEIPDNLVVMHPSLTAGKVPEDSASIGTAWLNRPTGNLALSVPSVIVPERNILINPNNTDFISIKWNEPRPLRLDDRLLRRR